MQEYQYPDLHNLENKDTDADDKFVLSNEEIKKFIDYCRKTFSVKEDDYFNTNTMHPEIPKTKIVYHYYEDRWWWPLFTQGPTYNYYIQSDSSNKDSKKKKDKKDDQSTLTKILLGTAGMALLGLTTYVATADWIEIQNLKRGKELRKKCKQTVLALHTNSYPMEKMQQLNKMIENFKHVYEHLDGYRKINMFSKIGMTMTGCIGFFGGLLGGAKFYGTSNIYGLLALFGASMVTYIWNKTYYIKAYQAEDEELFTELKISGDELWNKLSESST